MKTFFRLFWNELKVQRFVVLAALVLALLPFVLAPFVGKAVQNARDQIAMIGSLFFLVAAPWALGAPWLTSSSTGAAGGGEPPIPKGDWRLFASPLAARLLLVVLGAWLPIVPAIAAPLLDEFGSFGRPSPSPAELLQGFAGWTLLALSIFVLVQAGHFLVRDRSWRSLLDLAVILLAVAMLRFSAGLTDLGEARRTLLMALLGVWSASGLYSAWRSFKAGPPIEQAHRRYSLSMICSLLVLGAGTLLTAFLVAPR